MQKPANDNGDATSIFESDLAIAFIEALARDAARYDYALVVSAAAQGGNDDEAERRAA
jgi:hypothetical protein